jgi:nucleoside-triphosphatase THEP1
MMTSAARKLAALTGNDGAMIQALLAEMVADWLAAGTRIAGVTGETHGLPDRICGAGILREIATGKAHPIYIDTPLSRTSCHLDAAGVADACAAVISQIPTCDLVVLNKFGKLEAMGEGLAPALSAAVAAGKPVLTTVSGKHVNAWRELAPNSVILAAEKTAVQKWWVGAKA